MRRREAAVIVVAVAAAAAAHIEGRRLEVVANLIAWRRRLVRDLFGLHGYRSAWFESSRFIESPWLRLSSPLKVYGRAQSVLLACQSPRVMEVSGGSMA